MRAASLCSLHSGCPTAVSAVNPHHLQPHVDLYIGLVRHLLARRSLRDVLDRRDACTGSRCSRIHPVLAVQAPRLSVLVRVQAAAAPVHPEVHGRHDDHRCHRGDDDADSLTGGQVSLGLSPWCSQQPACAAAAGRWQAEDGDSLGEDDSASAVGDEVAIGHQGDEQRGQGRGAEAGHIDGL